MNNKRKLGISSFTLHIIAMVIMLIDHMWGTSIFPGNNLWMTNLGRIAFPIFAFMIVEGFFYTRNIKKYVLRLLVGAIISEIPFNLMMSGTIRDPYDQNVLWTLLLSLLCIWACELIKKKNIIAGYVVGILLFIIAFVIAIVCMLDYNGFGILMAAVFYFFRGDKWWKKILQFIGLYIVNVELFGGMSIDISLLGHTFEVVQQGFAVFAMIPILLYNHEQGPHNKVIQYCFYLFYPVHMLVLALISLYL